MTDIKVLSAEDILAAEDLTPIALQVPDWGGQVYVRPLRAAELKPISDWGKNKTEDQAIRLIIMSLVSDKDEPLFTSSEETVTALKRKGLRSIMRLQEAILKLNGLDEKVKEAKEAAKND